MDKSNGYEDDAETYMRARNGRIGLDVVRDWARGFAAGAVVLELGCGHGVVSEALVDAGAVLYAVDASPTLLRAFRERLPAVETECAPVETSTFFGRTFDGVLAWGLLFLLTEDAQRVVIAKMACALKPGGRLLFTAPRDACTWRDGTTGLPSLSLGVEAYEALLRGLELEVAPGWVDEGDNYYYAAVKGR